MFLHVTSASYLFYRLCNSLNVSTLSLELQYLVDFRRIWGGKTITVDANFEKFQLLVVFMGVFGITFTFIFFIKKEKYV